MTQPLLHWCKIYQELKQQSLCLDIETTGYNGPIAVIGLYKPKDGVMECESFVKGKNLDRETLRKAFDGCKMLITYNGLYFDVPKVKQEFPGIIREGTPVIDLYRFAKNLELDTNLKVLENTLGIERLEDYQKKRGIATKLWRKYSQYNDALALNMLLEYNRQDTINLYPIAEELVTRATKKHNQQNQELRISNPYSKSNPPTTISTSSTSTLIHI